VFSWSVDAIGSKERRCKESTELKPAGMRLEQAEPQSVLNRNLNLLLNLLPRGIKIKNKRPPNGIPNNAQFIAQG
jgi:hypothetical protein